MIRKIQLLIEIFFKSKEEKNKSTKDNALQIISAIHNWFQNLDERNLGDYFCMTSNKI